MSATTIDRQSSAGTPQPSILILGASARAAARSALPAGMRPIAADLFGDVDLYESADVLPLEKYPHGFPRTARLAPQCPWMYTGGLENHPHVVGAISADRPLWGNPADVIRRVRDPQIVNEVLRTAGLPVAEICLSDSPPQTNAHWLLKPTGGSGGGGIAVWNDATSTHPTLKRSHFFQRRVIGVPHAAVYLADGAAAHLIGVTRQFVGSRSLNSPRYSYCGSLGPLVLPAELNNAILSIGQALFRAIELRGLFGVDFLIDGNTATPIEVNPRYTASVEVLESAWDVPLLAWHRLACLSFAGCRQSRELIERSMPDVRKRPQRYCGKAVVYAASDFRAPPPTDLRTGDRTTQTYVADIPQPGALIWCGRPFCTVLARGRDARQCLLRLVRRVRRVKRFASEPDHS